MFKLDLEKAEEPEIKLPTSCCFWYCCSVSSVVSDSVRPHRQQPTRRPCPWDSPGKNTGEGCHFLLHANIHWTTKKKQESSRKTSTSASLTTPKPLTVWITTNSGKFLKRWEYQTTWGAFWEICMQIKKQQLEPDMSNRLVPNWERSMSRLYIVTLHTSLICRVHYVKCQAGWSTSRNQDCWGKYQ